MTRDDLQVRKTAVTLADVRALIYFGAVPERPADYPDRRQPDAAHVRSQARWDQLLGEWVVIASRRQDRTFQPSLSQCPLCPSSADSLTEVPAPDYEVVVFENAFPPRGPGERPADGDHGKGTGRPPTASDPPPSNLDIPTRMSGPARPGTGVTGRTRCVFGRSRLISWRAAVRRCRPRSAPPHHLPAPVPPLVRGGNPL